jgi:hypothetical protein
MKEARLSPRVMRGLNDVVRSVDMKHRILTAFAKETTSMISFKGVYQRGLRSVEGSRSSLPGINWTVQVGCTGCARQWSTSIGGAQRVLSPFYVPFIAHKRDAVRFQLPAWSWKYSKSQPFGWLLSASPQIRFVPYDALPTCGAG